MIKQKRVVVYMPEDMYNRLQSKLRLVGQTVSGWIRKKISNFLKD